MQGRLSPPLEGFQECPKNWKREFDLLDSAGIDYIDWVVTNKSWEDNPIFKEDVSNFAIGAICADDLVDARILEKDFLFSHVHKLAKTAIQNYITMITIPLLEESDMSDPSLRKEFCRLISEIGNHYHDLNFSFEAELSSSEILEIVEIRDNFSLTYDTGNITSCGFDHSEYIEAVQHKISCVHLKDRTFEGSTVEPGTGDTNFVEILDALNQAGYNGPFTLQTARNKSELELDTIKRHVEYFKELHNDKYV